jgi:hypothetical protein
MGLPQHGEVNARKSGGLSGLISPCENLKGLKMTFTPTTSNSIE